MKPPSKLTLALLLANENNNYQAIKDASAQLISLFNAAPDALIIIDQTGVIELINTTTQTMFLYNEHDLIGENISMLMPDSIKNAHDGYLSAYLQTGKTNIIGKGRKLSAIKSNGEEFCIFLSVGEVTNSSHTQFVGIISDISEQEKQQTILMETKEKLAQATRLTAMGELAAGIAHEINQPLAAILSYAQASKRLINSPGTLDINAITEPLEKICEQALRTHEVIDRLRTLVKRHTAQREKVDLYPLIHEAVRLTKTDPRMRGHEIELDLEEGKSIELFVDPIQIQQVLLNLIRNAVDAMEQEKGMPVKIGCRRLSGKEIEVSVTDSGKGITADASSSIFAPFFTTKKTGMGMGLSVCQTIIHGHGGRIYYRSKEPQETIFSFSLPLFTENQSGRE
nr:ATP-binding protein [uncultured Glaciecola sp.]